MNAPTHDEIRPYVSKGLVNAREHDGLVVYNYTEKCTYERAWDDVTRVCRGLIMEAGADVVVARSFDKFFNYGEGEHVHVPKEPPDLVSDKEDGSLAIGFWHGGRFRWSTRGSLTSRQAGIAQRIWDAQYAERASTVPKGLALLCEVMSPEIDSIIPAESDQLVLLACRWVDGREYSWPEVCELARWLTMFRASVYTSQSAEALVKQAKTLPASEEGWVLRWDNPDGSVYRLKIKGAEYLAIARLLQSLSPRGVADAWYFGRDDVLERVPEEFRAEIETEWGDLDAKAATLERAAHHDVLECATLDRRETVKRIGPKSSHFAGAMALLDGKDYDFRRLAYQQHTGHRFPREKFAESTEEG